MSHVSIRPTTPEDQSILDALDNLPISGPNQAIAKTSATTFANITLSSGGLSNITGLITAGTNIALTGIGTLIDPYVINSTGGGGTPASPDTSIQFNNAGVFAGSDNFKWNDTDSQILVTSAGYNAGLFFTAPLGIQYFNSGPLQIRTSGNEAVDISVNASDIGFGGGRGSDVRFFAGDTYDVATDAGSIQFKAGSAQAGNSNGGAFSLTSGNAMGDGNGGNIVFQAGSIPGAGVAGSTEFVAGDSLGTTDGGTSSLIGGTNSHSNLYSGGGITTQGGSESANKGGDAIVQGGFAAAGQGGDVQLIPGFGVGTNGSVKIKDPANLLFAKFDTSLILTTDKIFTFPNTSGTFAMQSAASGSFTTVDLKTVTVVNGIITSIV